MTKITTPFTIIAVGIVGLAGCSNIIEKEQNPISEKQKTISEDQNSNAEQKPAKEIITETEQVALYTDFTQERYSELLGKKPFAIFFSRQLMPRLR